jgi:hypothetical protein
MKLPGRELFLAVCLCSFILSISAQQVDKPFQSWSKDEVIKLLSHSPWAQTYPDRAQTYQSQAPISTLSRDITAGAKASVPVVVRLHSALPVRQALIRLRQIQVNYDKLSQSERADFDKTTEGFLNCTICQKYYVVTLTRFVDSSGKTIGEGVFQRMNLDQLRGNVWLANDKGERRELVQFNPPNGVTDMAVLYFARLDEKGNTFLTPAGRKFELGFNSAFLAGGNPYGSWLPLRFEFNVAKLVVDNRLLF